MNQRVATWTIRLMGEERGDDETVPDFDYRNVLAKGIVNDFMEQTDLENHLSSLLPDGYYVKVEE